MADSFYRTAAALESSLTNSLQWCNKNCMCFNESRTQLMVISRSLADTQISCGNNTIVVSDTISDLGVTNNANLKRDSHTLNKISKHILLFYLLKEIFRKISRRPRSTDNFTVAIFHLQ